jgi:hypothetical protein
VMKYSAIPIATSGELAGIVSAGAKEGQQQFARLSHDQVQVFDDVLRPVATHTVTTGTPSSLLAAQGIDEFVLRIATGAVVVNGSAPVTVTEPIDAAVFIDNVVLAVSRSDAGTRILLVDPATGRVLDETRHAFHAEGALIHCHPGDAVALVDLPMGQDGSTTLRARVHGGTLDVDEILTDRDCVVSGFNSSGTHVLLAPYPSEAEDIVVVNWPELDEHAKLSATDLNAECGLGLAAAWVDDEHVAFFASEDSLIVAQRDFVDAERVPLPLDFAVEGDIEAMRTLTPGRLALGIWTKEGRHTLIVDVLTSGTGS